MRLESYVIDMIEGRRKGKQLLAPFSLLYQCVSSTRNWAYDHHLLKTVSVPIPVVSIGNIVSGGTGKTPLIRLLAETLSSSVKVAIVSRGYRSSIERSNRVVEISSLTHPRECGDEPYWLKSCVPSAAVWVGKNKSLSALRAQIQGAQLILLDDGMQHRKLERDIEMVAMDGRDLFGKGDFLPKGYLRDSPHRLEKADLIVVQYLSDEAHYEAIKEQLKNYTSAPVVGTRLVPQQKHMQGRVGLFGGLGKPSRFLETVEQCGIEVVEALWAPDHCLPSLQALQAFSDRCQTLGAESLLCTEKDSVKLSLELRTSLPIIPFRTTMEIAYGTSHWDLAIQHIFNKVSS